MDFFSQLFILVLLHLVSANAPDDVPYPQTPPGSSGGWHSEINEYIWAVGVHRKSEDSGNFEHICGGSLITQDLVITAAHCFWNQGNRIPLEDYRISAGNLHRDMNVDWNTQKREIKRAILHERYRDHDLNYASDIAIIQLKEDVVLNDVVGTIDIDWSISFEDSDLRGKPGIVVGWGFTEHDVPSEVRVAVNLPYVQFEDCYEVVPREFRSSLTPDKFCAGLRNEEQTSVVPVPPPVASGWKPLEEQYNWAVGVHRIQEIGGNFEQICGGSLIRNNVVLSAAHCFWNGGNDVALDQYRITAGTSLRDLESDTNSQKREIQELIFHERYRDHELNYAHDIVIVVLTEAVTINKLTHPVAIDWNVAFDDQQLLHHHGIVVGWGFNENDTPSYIRTAAALPYVDFNTCWKTVPREFRVSVTADKFCAGLQNGTAVCPGDSGSGLAFFNQSDVTWYLRGIVSVGPAPEDNSQCHKTQFAVFTSISSYCKWLEQKLHQLDTLAVDLTRSGNPHDVLIFSD